MGYGIVDEEPIKKQYLFSIDEVQVNIITLMKFIFSNLLSFLNAAFFKQQLNVPVHSVPLRPESPAPPPCVSLRKAISTDSLDSTTSSLMDSDCEAPTVNLVLSYHE